MNFESEINNLNKTYFFKEFTFSKNTFKLSDNQEVEVADSLVFLGGILFAFQLKQRDLGFNSTEEKEKIKGVRAL